MANALERLEEFIELEISFHSEVEFSRFRRFIFWLFRWRPCNEVVVQELEFMKEYLKREVTS